MYLRIAVINVSCNEKWQIFTKSLIYTIQFVQTTEAAGRVSGPVTTNGVWPTVASVTGSMTVGITRMKLSVAVSHSRLISRSIRLLSEGRIQPH